MEPSARIQLIQQSYKLAMLSHILAKAYQLIYQNSLYSLISNTDQSELAKEYENKVVENLSELSLSISDMSACMLHRNPTAFDKIYDQINKEVVATVTMFNEINEAARKNDTPRSDIDSESGEELA